MRHNKSSPSNLKILRSRLKPSLKVICLTHSTLLEMTLTMQSIVQGIKLYYKFIGRERYLIVGVIVNAIHLLIAKGHDTVPILGLGGLGGAGKEAYPI